MLIAQHPPRDSERLITQPAPPIPPPPDRGVVDWGIALAICAWAGNKLWGMFSQQQTAESKTQELLLGAVLKQNEILITALVQVLSQRKP